MAKAKYNLEDLRAKCRGYGNVGVGARQLEFVFSELDAQKDRADTAAVSYTHLDVYKRQNLFLPNQTIWSRK